MPASRTAILFFTKTGSGGTDHVWFYDMKADGWSLDDKRNPLLPREKLGPAPKEALTETSTPRTTCPTAWRAGGSARMRAGAPAHRAELLRAEGRHRRSGLRPLLNRYKEVVHEEVEHRPPLEIIAELRAIEEEIQRG